MIFEYPKNVSEIVCYENEINIIKNWINEFKLDKKTDDFKNALLITGPTGSGKTILAHKIFEEENYTIMEYNALDTRTSKELYERIELIICGDSIEYLFNEKRTVVIIDEIDGLDSKKDFSVTDILNLINYDKVNNELNKNIKKKKSQMPIRTLRNRTPIVLIASDLPNSYNTILKDVLHIKLPLPTERSIELLIRKLNTTFDLEFSDEIVRELVPNCQNDFRRTIMLTDYISHYVNSEYNDEQIKKTIKSLGTKDIDCDLQEALDKTLYTTDKSLEYMSTLYYADQNFYPLLLHENILTLIDKTNVDLSRKIDISLKFYEYFITSLLFKTTSFGNWDIHEYISYLTGGLTNILCKELTIKNKIVCDKSAMISKYNYRYYNLKVINSVCKKLNLNINNFQNFSIFICYVLFELNNMDFLNRIIKYLVSKNIEFKEFDKCIKFSLEYEKYEKMYISKKYQKFIKEKYASFEEVTELT